MAPLAPPTSPSPNMKITWYIGELIGSPEVNGLSNVVTRTSWCCVLEDGDKIAESYGTVTFQEPNPDTFIPFELLSKERVMEWCISSGLDRSKIEAALADQISRSEIILNPPWTK